MTCYSSRGKEQWGGHVWSRRRVVSKIRTFLPIWLLGKNSRNLCVVLAKIQDIGQELFIANTYLGGQNTKKVWTSANFCPTRKKLSQPLRFFWPKNSRYGRGTFPSRKLFSREKDQNSLDIHTFLSFLSDSRTLYVGWYQLWQKIIQQGKRSKK